METAITRMLGIRYPIVAAPMFLVSNAPLLQAVAEAGLRMPPKSTFFHPKLLTGLVIHPLMPDEVVEV